MTLVTIESPFAGKGDTEEERDRETERNLRYVRACMADCFVRGEEPYPSHALFTQPGVLDDKIPEERKKGMEAGFSWGALAQKRVLYKDLGVSSGMVEGINRAKQLGQVVEERTLGKKWAELENKLVVPVSLAAELARALHIKAVETHFECWFADTFEEGYRRGIQDSIDLIKNAR